MGIELDENEHRVVTILNKFGFIPVECNIIVVIRRHGTIDTRGIAEALNTTRERVRKYTARLQTSGVIDSTMYRHGFIYKLRLDFFDNLYAIAEQRYRDDIRRIKVLEEIF